MTSALLPGVSLRMSAPGSPTVAAARNLRTQREKLVAGRPPPQCCQRLRRGIRPAGLDSTQGRRRRAAVQELVDREQVRRPDGRRPARSSSAARVPVRWLLPARAPALARCSATAPVRLLPGLLPAYGDCSGASARSVSASGANSSQAEVSGAAEGASSNASAGWSTSSSAPSAISLRSASLQRNFGAFARSSLGDGPCAEPAGPAGSVQGALGGGAAGGAQVGSFLTRVGHPAFVLSGKSGRLVRATATSCASQSVELGALVRIRQGQVQRLPCPVEARPGG